MTVSTLARFEASLDELDVSVSHTDADAFQHHVEGVVEPHAVGVALDEAFEDPDLSLSDTGVEVDPTPATLREATTGVTGARLAVADYGSVVLSPNDGATELVSLFVDRHVVVVRESDVREDMDAAIDALAAEFRRTGESAILATGPSATADMGALVKGAHGPREVHVVVLTEDGDDDGDGDGDEGDGDDDAGTGDD